MENLEPNGILLPGMPLTQPEGLFASQHGPPAYVSQNKKNNSDLVLGMTVIKNHKPSEGSVAKEVLIQTLQMEIVKKSDDKRVIIEEARFLQHLRNRPELPPDLHTYFPTVFEIQSKRAPYYYRMECIHAPSFAEQIFVRDLNQLQAITAFNKVLSLLFRWYEKTRVAFKNVRPDIRHTYINRIVERVNEARQVNNLFNKLSRDRLKINNTWFEPIEHYLEQIDKNLKPLLYKHSSWIHGDPHLENILLGYTADLKPVIKFIDPKIIYNGDYMFDIGKICHYLFATGPAERIINPPVPHIDVNAGTLDYQLELNRYHVHELLSVAHKKLEKYAVKFEDYNWKSRYRLSVAANLLGTQVARLTSGDPVKINSAFMLYGEGMSYLANVLT